MKFSQRHPYLFWELIGFLVLFADFVFLVICALLDAKNDAVYATIAFTAIVAGFIVFISPLIIFIIRLRNSKTLKLNNLAETIICTEKPRYIWETVLIVIAMLFAFVAVTGLICYTGLVFLTPIGAYASVAIYIPWRKHILSKFYKVKNAEQYCELISANDTDFFDKLDKEYTISTLTLEDKPSAELLNFLYNALNLQGFIKNNRLRIYILDNALISRIYSFNPELSLLCVFPDDLNISDKKELNRLLNNSPNNIFGSYETVVHFLMEDYIKYVNLQ